MTHLSNVYLISGMIGTNENEIGVAAWDVGVCYDEMLAVELVAQLMIHARKMAEISDHGSATLMVPGNRAKQFRACVKEVQKIDKNYPLGRFCIINDFAPYRRLFYRYDPLPVLTM